MVYHTFLSQFQPSFSISGQGDGFKKRYAFLIIISKRLIFELWVYKTYLRYGAYR